MTRQDAINCILAIVDGAQPPVAPATEQTPAASSNRKQSARGARAASSSSSPDGAADRDNPPATEAAAPPLPPRVSSFADDDDRAPSQMGGQSDDVGHDGEEVPPAKTDDEIAEERRREEELRRAALNGELAHLPMTDLGNCERFRKRFGHLFKWNASLGWLYWDGRRWGMKGADERVRIAAHETVRAIQDEAKALFDEADAIAEQFGEGELEELQEASKAKKQDKKSAGKRKKKKVDVVALDRKKLEAFMKFKRLQVLGVELAEWGLASEMNSKITPIDKHAAPYLAVDIEQLDADPWMFNVSNGTLIVDRDAPRYLRFKPHDPADLITKISPVEYRPGAKCPEFDRFVQRVQPDGATRRLLFAWMGYSLTGDASEQKLVFLHGEGRNGKGVFVRICSTIAGDYAKTTPIETFLAETGARNASAPTPHLAALVGVRLLTTNEPKKNAQLDEAFVKLITGEDMISARPLNKPQFEYKPNFKLTISGNHQPRINDQTESIWARMVKVPWAVIIPKEERDLKLDEKLRAEASGVLNVLLDGLRDWVEHGLVLSEAIEEATARYREDSDPLGRFLADCVDRSDAARGSRVQSSELHELYIAWAKATGGPEWKHTGFTNAMKERGFVTKKSNAMFFVDIRTTKHVSDFVDHLGKPVHDTGATSPERSFVGRDDDEIYF